MKNKPKWIRIMYYAGITAMIAGILDPLEGSVVIAAGSILVAIATMVAHDRYRMIFLACCLMILTGTVFLFYLSSLGGFGGTSELSWWWGTLILPYPIGWLMTIITLIIRSVKNKKLSPLT